MGETIGLHPNFSPLSAILEDNDYSFIQKVGIREGGDPGRSHDSCQKIMSAGVGADTAVAAISNGWIARLMDNCNFNSYQVFAFGNFGSKLDFNTSKNSPIVIPSNVDSYERLNRNFGNWYCPEDRCTLGGSGRRNITGAEDTEYANQIAAQLRELSGSDGNDLIEEIKDSYQLVGESISFIQDSIRPVVTTGDYLNAEGVKSTFARHCQDAARFLRHAKVDSSLSESTRMVYLQRGGWDTHDKQVNSLSGLISDISVGLRGLVKDLKDDAQWDNTAVLVYSEFGRTNYENSASTEVSGTDHAWANTQLLLSGSLRNSVVGDSLSLSDLSRPGENYIRPTTDYRDVLNALVKWASLEPGEPFLGYNPQSLELFS